MKREQVIRSGYYVRFESKIKKKKLIFLMICLKELKRSNRNNLHRLVRENHSS